MKWEIINKTTANRLQSTDKIIEILLENRGVKSEKQKKEFLNPKHPSKISASEIGINEKELQKAIKRVKLAVKNNEQIIVYGDYDADGVCATAIVWEALDVLGAKATPFIPDRFEHGYGLNARSIENLKFKISNLKLIVTVDNGIVAYEALEEAKRLGVDVIITDHHTFEKKPKAYAIVHTLKTSGSGVAWFFARALGEKTGLELAAIGTIADQLSLLGVNRAIVKHGLAELNRTTRLGLRKLLMVSGLLGKQIGTYEVGFMIAPRINASGRIAQGMDALRLLCTRNRARAEALANTLNELNRERQSMVDEAIAFSAKTKPEDNLVLVLADKKYHEGVIGLVAGKLVSEYNRPSIVLSIREGLAKASARSIAGFNIIEAIRAQSELIIEGGGHAMAAGFSIQTKNIKIFSKKVNEYAKVNLSPELLDKKINVDLVLPFSFVSQKVYNMLAVLEPYGIGNPAPLFVTKHVGVVEQKLVGKLSTHLKLVLAKDGNKVEGMLFNWNRKIDSGFVDVCYRMTENTWNGKTAVELFIKDIKWKKSIKN